MATHAADEILSAADDVPLTDVVASGSREVLRAWLDTKLLQWDDIKPYLTAAYQALHEPDVAAQMRRWFEGTISAMTEGLEKADRLDPERRRIRCVLAFGQLEYLSRRFFAVGWQISREISLEELTDSWCYLLDMQD